MEFLKGSGRPALITVTAMSTFFLRALMVKVPSMA